MPLNLPLVSFTETPEAAYYVYPLKVKPEKVDIAAHQYWVKITQGVYLVEFDLPAPIAGVPQANLSVPDGTMTLTLRKQDPCVWGTPTAAGGDPEERARRRQESIAAWQEEQAKARAERSATKDQLRRFALAEQMQTEERTRAQLDAAVRAEKQDATAKIFESGATAAPPAAQGTAPSAAVTSERSAAPDSIGAGIKPAVLAPSTAPASEPPTRKKLPPPRHARRVAAAARSGPAERPATVPTVVQTLSFTPRLFPTPLRESKAAEEAAWLAKNGGHVLRLRRGQAGFQSSDVEWLKSRGDAFFKQGDYASAINAYTAACAAVDPAGSRPDVFLNRAACHLALEHFNDCVADCDAVLSTSSVALTSAQYTKAVVRRALALWWAGMHDECVNGLDTAVQSKADKDADVIGGLLDRARRSVTIVARRRLGDAAAARHDWEDAKREYEGALELEPESFRTRLNFATVLLRTGAFEQAKSHAHRAMEDLRAVPAAQRRMDCGADAAFTAAELACANAKLAVLETVDNASRTHS